MSRKHGELEAEVLRAIWDLEEAGIEQISSNDILSRVSKSGDLALTTVLTVLTRLTEKGLVTRNKIDGKAWSFSSTNTRTAHTATLLKNLLDSADNQEVVMAHFVGQLPASLRQTIQTALKQKKS